MAVKSKSITPRIEPGNIYAAPILENEFIFCRVMLAVSEQCFDTGKVTTGSEFDLFENTFLIEIYRETYTKPALPAATSVLIKGIFCSFRGFVTNGQWQLVGHAAVHPEEVYFPGFLMGQGAYNGLFVRGEVAIEFPMDLNDVEAVGITPGTFPAVGIDALYLKNAGRDSDIPTKYLHTERFLMSKRDIYQSHHLNGLVQKVGADILLPYPEFSQKHGYDFRRFYS
ncbi:MAG: Imm26 family immunity protein [Chitinophagales bacterium]